MAVEYRTILFEGLLKEERIGVTLLRWLTYREKICFLDTCTSLYSHWMRKTRMINIWPTFILYLQDEEYRRKIFSKVEDPSKQICVGAYLLDSPLIIGDPMIFRFTDLTCKLKSFRQLMRASSRPINFDCLSINGEFGECLDAEVLSTIANTTQSLSISCAVLPLNLDFLSPTLTSLTLTLCKSAELSCGSLTLPYLPLLTECSFFCVNFTNYEVFTKCTKLRQLDLTSTSHTVSLKNFSAIKILSISTCHNLVDFEYLQENEEIKLLDSNGNNLGGSFCNTKKIYLQYGEEQSRNFQLVSVDLSFYSQCEEFTLRFDKPHFRLAGSRITSSDSISSSIQKITLQGLRQEISLSSLRNIRVLTLARCTADLSLSGLQSVNEVYLNNLSALTSLEGLGKNQRVEISQCPLLVEFSAVNGVPTVKIVQCKGFTNIAEVSQVEDLTLEKCINVEDLSALKEKRSSIQSLKILNCNRLQSIEGLAEIIPSFSCAGCRRINPPTKLCLDLSKADTRPIGFMSIPDAVYPMIFNFLTGHCNNYLLRVNTYLQYMFSRKFRTVYITPSIAELFSESSEIQEILETIQDPGNQLQLLDTIDQCLLKKAELFVVNELPVGFPLLNYHSLELHPEMFLTFCNSFPGRHWSVKHLIVKGSTRSEGNYSISGSTRRELLSHLDKASHSLTIAGIDSFGTQSLTSFASTLLELNLRRCYYCAITLPPLFSLRKLSVYRFQQVVNLTDARSLFPALTELSLAQLNEITSVEAFRSIKILRLEALSYLKASEVSSLQEQDTVILYNMFSLCDFRHSFSMTKTVQITSSSTAYHYVNHLEGKKEEELYFDLSRYRCLERFRFKGNEETGTMLSNEQLCATDQLPPSSLRELSLTHVHGFSSVDIFRHLRCLTLIDCPEVVSLEGLSPELRYLRLSRLPALTSLSGVNSTTPTRGGQQEIVEVVVESCQSLVEFSALKRVKKVSIKDCPGLRGGEDLVEVQRLFLEACQNLEDLSMLRGCKELQVKGCRKLRTIGDLASRREEDRVKVLIVRCKALES